MAGVLITPAILLSEVTMIIVSLVQKLAVAILTDENGASEDTYKYLRMLLFEFGLPTPKINATNGRLYIPAEVTTNETSNH